MLVAKQNIGIGVDDFFLISTKAMDETIHRIRHSEFEKDFFKLMNSLCDSCNFDISTRLRNIFLNRKYFLVSLFGFTINFRGTVTCIVL